MRIGFAGTPAFAATALQAILDAGKPVVLALSQPDRPHGRGWKLEPGPVTALARARGIPLFQPARLKDAGELAPIIANDLDLLVVAAYGLILPPALLSWPRHGCINIHASLLPRWRGAAPIQRALLAGDSETGISIMRMDSGLDTGPVISRHRIEIAPRQTAGTLQERLASAGAEEIVAALARLEREGRLEATPQTQAEATYAAKIDPREAEVDWTQDAPAIDRQIRALDPAPGARTTLDGALLKIWVAEPGSGRLAAPGTVVRADAAGILIACGEGVLLVRELQRAGGKHMSAAAFLAGHALAPRARFGASQS